MTKLLHELVADAARQTPDAVAMRGPEGTWTYAQLDAWADRWAWTLRRLGVVPGDRVALWSRKSCRAVAAMQGCLRLGAAYVPIAPDVPATRARMIVDDCAVRCLVVDRARAAGLGELRRPVPSLCLDDDAGDGPAPEQVPALPIPDSSLAYVLYTSGSTGQPKGVCVSHRGALAFVEWAVAEVRLHERSRLANHAAFNFDVSVFDLYAAFKSRGSVSIVPEALSRSPAQLVEFIRREGITVWTSVTSALVLMIEQGGLLDPPGLPLETVVFGGEVFPLPELRRLREAAPGLRLLNFYGPTETNVCASYDVVAIDPARTTPVPVGRPACGNTVWLGDATGRPVQGDEGEVFVQGPTVMLGYWGGEAMHDRPFATGDICRIDADGNFVFVGRKDDMVKIRGHRVELGEVEAALRLHPGVADVAVVALGEGAETRLVAFFVASPSGAPTLLRLKEHCAARLPPYMVVAMAWALDVLPRTPNGKTDRHRLIDLAAALAGERSESPLADLAAPVTAVTRIGDGGTRSS